MTSLSEEIHYAPDHINFSMFSVDELRKLSKVEVTNKVAINDLGHPLPDGLYDLRMGPYMRDYGVCASCHMNYEHCPGHIGHIELALPVLNPLLRSVALSLLNRCCLNCSAFLVPSATLQLFSAQLKLLRHGLLADAISAGDLIKINSAEPARKTSVGRSSDLPDAELAPLLELSDTRSERVRKLLEEVLPASGGGSLATSFRNVDVRNVVVEKRALLRRFLSCRPIKTCLECRTVQPSLCDFSGQIIRTEKTAAGKRRKSAGSSAEAPATEVRNTLTYVQARDVLRRLWQREGRLLADVFGVLAAARDHEHPTDCLFMQALPVISPRLRPISQIRGVLAQHSLTELYSHVMLINEVLSVLMRCKKEGIALDQLPDTEQRMARAVMGSSIDDKLIRSWINLQCMVDCLVDVDMNKTFYNRMRIKHLRGIRQLLEKKEGIIRMNLMGKRVDYAGRTVITPDPYLNVQEMGVPEVMAKRLTYPEPVTALNISVLQQAVLNGPEVYPGANAVEFGNGSLVLLKNRPQQLAACARSLLTPAQQTGAGSAPVPKVVHRHLSTGDMVLLNRQPTLHRPSIMAHRVRVLPGEKTFRLHYSNCKSYNADFDGDEMNAHLPQGEEARSEALHLAFSPYHFLVPKDGTPLGGLIQDHVIAGVKLSMRGRFLTRDQYMQMVENALTASMCPGRLQVLPPAILKPCVLWTGKQVISTLLLNLTPPGSPAICLESTAQLTARSWQRRPPRACRAGGPLADGEMCESRVLIRGGHLVCGVLDKRQFGAVPFSLVHAFHELYGGLASSALLSALSRLFTHCLQVFGFTLGVADILVRSDADGARADSAARLPRLGACATRLALGLSDVHMSDESIREQLERCHLAKDVRATRDLDRAYKKQLDSVNNDINKQCLPLGLLTQFPDNNLQLMVEAGAKGSKVNTMQISCLLGQIELEGKRPPRMLSGKTLPSFLPYDLSPRAGGFISGRFMTGIRPQEYFFHCMAGREGLIDTAVKTSRSGYLQRCLVKHLEGLVVGYDLSVRDADGSVIQLRYGEDGHETQRVQHLSPKQLHLYSQNRDAVVAPSVLEQFRQCSAVKQVTKRKRRIARWCRDFSRVEPGRQRSSGFLEFCREAGSSGRRKEELVAAWRACGERGVYERRARRCPDPVAAEFRPDVHLSAVCERLDRLIDSYTAGDEQLAALLHYKCARACVQAGEAVGLVAAQSIGEPSTQMTLNTFHFAGRGDMNVTLGIPRLKEILSASQHTKTPSMQVPFLANVSAARAERLRRQLCRVDMRQLLRDVTVTEQLRRGSCRLYQLRVRLLPRRAYRAHLSVTPVQVMHYVETTWVRVLLRALSKAFNFRDSDGVLDGGSSRGRASDTASAVWSQSEDSGVADVDDPGDEPGEGAGEEGGAPEAVSSDEEVEPDDDATAARSRKRRDDQGDYESEEEEEEETQEQNDKLDEDHNEEEEMEPDEKSVHESGKLARGLSVERRVQSVLAQRTEHCQVVEYSYDTERELWCQLTIRAATCAQCDIQAVVRHAAEQGVVRHVPGITRAFVVDGEGERDMQLVTEGINLLHVVRYDRVLDLNRLHCNDLHALAASFGVEAAARAITREIAAVFAVYGISVNARHLSLVADYMTFGGRVAGFNRGAMDAVVSPLQQMTFETSMKFLRAAVVDGQCERLQSPSARLVFGQPFAGGTGMFSLINKLVE